MPPTVIFKRAAFLSLLVLTLLVESGCSSMMRSSSRNQRRQPLAFAKWKEYKPEDGSFVVFFPDTPKTTSKPLTATKSNSYRSKTRGQTFTVSVSTALSDEVAFRRDSDAGAASRRATALSGSAKDQKEIKFAGENALECRWDSGSAHHRAIVFKTHQGTHLYALKAAWGASGEPENVQKFFDSFKPGAYTAKPVPTATPSAQPTPGGDDDEVTPSPKVSGTPQASDDEDEVEVEVEPTGSPSPGEGDD